MSMDQVRFILLSFLVSLVSAEGEISNVFLDKCPKFHIRKSTIIQSKKSVDDGAVYLGKKTVSSARGCHELCCKKDGCNLVTLKYEIEGSLQKVSCFMFNCRSPSVCSFYQHSSYHSYAALEYEDAKGRYSPDHKDEQPEVTTTTTEAPEPTTAKPVHKPKQWDWLQAITTTKPDYIEPKNNHGRFDSNVHQNTKKNWLDEQIDKVSTTHDSHKTTNTKHVNSWHNSAPKNTEYNNHDNTKYGTYDHTQDSEKPIMKTTQAPNDDEEEFQRRVFVDNNPDFPEEPQNDHSKPTLKLKTAKPKTANPNTKATKRAPTKPRGMPVSNVVIRKLNIQENKAVIPLAVGLVLALLLLMGVIFRLKTSRRRRTKAFLTDDADYLINGMYL